ncbi:MAG: GrdX family protein [Oscillospiraceae bacterium]
MLITNNPLLGEHPPESLSIQWVDGDYGDVLFAVRDKVHRGHRLLSHPLAGSIKPNETPFRTVAVSETAAAMDVDSLRLIEEAILLWQRTVPRRGLGAESSPELRRSFAMLDLDLLGLSEEKGVISCG